MQKAYVDDHIAVLAPCSDVRVLRRMAREMWNAIAGVHFPMPLGQCTCPL